MGKLPSLCLYFICRTILASEMAGRFCRDMNSLFKITWTSFKQVVHKICFDITYSSILIYLTSEASSGLFKLLFKLLFKTNLVELGIGPSGEEAVQFDQEAEINVLGYGLLAVHLTVLLVVYINTHGRTYYKDKSEVSIQKQRLNIRHNIDMQ